MHLGELVTERRAGHDQQLTPPIQGLVHRSLQRGANRTLVDSAWWLVEDRGDRPARSADQPLTDQEGRDRPRGEAVHQHDSVRRAQRVAQAGRRDELDRGAPRRRGFGHPAVIQVPAGHLGRRPAGHEGDDEHRGALEYQSRRSLYPPKASFDSHTRTDKRVDTGTADRVGEEVVRPTGEDLHGDGLCVVGADDVEVLVAHDAVDPLQRGVEDVEIDDHAAVVQLLPFDDDVEAVVVRVQLPLRPFDTRHDVLR